MTLAIKKYRHRFLCALVAVVCVCLVSGAQAETSAWEEGTHFVRLTIKADTPEDTIELTEVFSYGCPHCMNLEAPLKQWLARQPRDVTLRRVPATFSQPYQRLASIFYAGEQLGVLERIHRPLFEAIQMRNLNVLQTNVLQRFFMDYADIDSETLDKALASFSVQTKVRQADALARTFRVTAVPTLVVAGEYKVTPPRAYGGARQLQIVEHLIDLVRSERATSSSE